MHPHKYDILEVFRFISAFAIMFHHMPLGFAGAWGVNLFFMISGFVMMECTKAGDPQFFRKRLIRIVPFYWLLTLTVFVIALIAPSLMNNTTADLEHLIKSLFFIPFDKNGSGHAPILFVGWTLNYEMLFYLIFGLSLTVTVRYRAVISTIILGTVMALFSYNDGFVSGVLASAGLMDFAAGMLLFSIANIRQIEARIILLQVAIMLCSLFLSNHALDYKLYSTSIACFLVMGAAIVSCQKAQFHPIVCTLGAATYVMYLIHAFVIQAFDKLLNAFDVHETSIMHHGHHIGSQSIIIIAIVAIVVGLSVLIHRRLELPLNSLLRAKFLKPNVQGKLDGSISPSHA